MSCSCREVYFRGSIPPKVKFFLDQNVPSGHRSHEGVFEAGGVFQPENIRLYHGIPFCLSVSCCCFFLSFCKNTSPADWWQSLYLRPLPHGQGSFLLTRSERWGPVKGPCLTICGVIFRLFRFIWTLSSTTRNCGLVLFSTFPWQALLNLVLAFSLKPFYSISIATIESESRPRY